jgi:S1-C subfamily serine protease
VAIYDGFSGGPLVDARGRVIGINTSGLARASAITIPGSTVERVTEQLLSSGRVRRGYIGLGLQPVKLPSGVAKQLGLARDVGLMVVSLEEDAPAHNAGVSLGDIVIAFDGGAVSEPTDLLAALTGDRIGKPVAVRVLRGGTPVDISITVGERPARGEK